MKKLILPVVCSSLVLSSVVLSDYNIARAASLDGASASVSQSAAKASSDPLNGPQDPKELEAFADQLFADKMKKFNVNGSNFVVVKDGQIVLNKGYGFADKEKGIPVDKDTVFQIASVTKTFTALAVMQLVDQGKIDLHEDIQKYLGGIQIPNKTGKPLTMYDLLTYTSGFDKPDSGFDVGPDYLNKDFPLKEYITKNMPTVVRTPGEAYTYSNFGFSLAGYVVENVSGMPFHKYMDENVFKPLGMNSSNLLLTPEILAKMAAHYGPDGKPHPTFGTDPTDYPAGGIASTGEDMAKYLIMQLQNGKFGDKQIVSRKSMDMMHTFQIMADKTVPQTTVGFEAFFNDYANDQYVVLKGGSHSDHSSLIVLLPEKNTAMYLSYNNDTFMNKEVYQEFMNHYYPKDEKTPKTNYLPLNEKQAEKYIGLYKNTRTSILRTKLSYADGKLVIESGFTGKHTLGMINPLLFEDETGNKVAFKKDHNGNVEYYYNANPDAPDIAADAQKMDIKPFLDVPNDSKYKTHIDNVRAFGIMDAKSDNLFDPQGTMTQGEFADTINLAFGDIPASMKDAFKLQMISGIPEIDPTAPITRQAAAVMIQNIKQLLANLAHTPVPPMLDVKLIGQTDDWAVKAITALVSQGIVDPDTIVNSDGSVDFHSTKPLLRQEASALLDLAFDYYTLPIKTTEPQEQKNNQQRYLEQLVVNGTYGQAEWAKDQLAKKLY